jgi:hypothetical protein
MYSKNHSAMSGFLLVEKCIHPLLAIRIKSKAPQAKPTVLLMGMLESFIKKYDRI